MRANFPGARKLLSGPFRRICSSERSLNGIQKKTLSGKKDIQLDSSARDAFNTLKKEFIPISILALFDSDLKTVIETDYSGWAMGACLSQWDKKRKL